MLNGVAETGGHSGLIYMPELLAFGAAEYQQLRAGTPLNDALRNCARLTSFEKLVSFIAESPIDLVFLSSFTNFQAVARGEDLSDFSEFQSAKFWSGIGPMRIGTDREFSEGYYEEDGLPLSKVAYEAALNQLAIRFNKQESEFDKLGIANSLMNSHRQLLRKIKEMLAEPCPRANLFEVAPAITSDVDILSNIPPFISVFALAARCAGNGLLEFPWFMKSMEQCTGKERSVESALNVMLEIAPELFGYYLFFWEVLIKSWLATEDENNDGDSPDSTERRPRKKITAIH